MRCINLKPGDFIISKELFSTGKQQNELIISIIECNSKHRMKITSIINCKLISYEVTEYTRTLISDVVLRNGIKVN